MKTLKAALLIASLSILTAGCTATGGSGYTYNPQGTAQAYNYLYGNGSSGGVWSQPKQKQTDAYCMNDCLQNYTGNYCRSVCSY
jgi:hypothetical protein